MDNPNVLGSMEQLKIDNTSVSLQPKNNKHNSSNRNNRHNNNCNSHNHNVNNNNRHSNNRNHNRNNNNSNNRNYRNHYNEDEDPELLLAFEISKAEYEEQQRRKDSNNSSNDNGSSIGTTTTTTTSTSSSNINNASPIKNINSNNNNSNIQQQNLDNSNNKKSKKGQSIDMTHLLKFQSTSPHHRSPYINSSYSSNSSHINTNSYRPPRNSYRNNSNNNSNNNNSQSSSSYNNHHKNKNYKNKKPIQDTTFLQANYLFRINPFGNYQNALREVDNIVSWNKVEQVIYLTSEDTQFQCPICLDSPVIPKITKCGHILCYCCILRSLSHTNKCPLCLLPIESKQDLKSLEVKRTKKFKDGDEITLQLIKYQEGSTVPFLSTQTIPEKISFPSQDQFNCLFSRFSIVDNIDDIIDKEMDQLIQSRETALSECESETLKFLTEASSNIQDRQSSFKKLLDSRYSEGSTYITILKNSSSNSNKKEFDSYQCSNNFEIRMALEEYFNSNDQDYATPEDNSDNDDNEDSDSITSGLSSNGSINSSVSSISTNSTTNNNSKDNIKVPLSTLGSNNNNNEKSNIELGLESFSYENQPANGQFYLYQSNDGQKIYLHPLCMKILDYEFKKANLLPSTIRAKVYELEDYQVTEQSRKQYKSFNVLALTTGIIFAEIDLSSVVSKETLQHFHKEIKQRKDARFNKKRKEQRIQRGKELERAKDLERALELREISRKEKELEMEKEAKRLEQEKKDREEQLKNSANQKVKRQLGFLEAIQTHKNIDSIEEFPSL